LAKTQPKVSSKERRKGFISLLALSFVFSTMGIFARYLQYDFTLLQQVFLRIFIALIFALVFFFKDIRFFQFFTIPKKDITLIIFRAITLYGGIALISEAVFHAKYGNVSFIGSFPVLTLIGFFIFKDKFSANKLFCILLAFAGLFLIGVSDFTHIFSIGYGELLAFISAFFFAFSYAARKWQSDHLTNKEMTVAIFFIGSLLLFLMSFFILHEPLPTSASFTKTAIIALLLSGLFNVANLFLTNYGFARVDNSVAGNILTLENIFAILYGVFLFSEIPTIKEIIGGVAILISIIWLNNLEKNKK